MGLVAVQLCMDTDWRSLAGAQAHRLTRSLAPPRQGDVAALQDLLAAAGNENGLVEKRASSASGLVPAGALLRMPCML